MKLCNNVEHGKIKLFSIHTQVNYYTELESSGEGKHLKINQVYIVELFVFCCAVESYFEFHSLIFNICTTFTGIDFKFSVQL